MPKKCEHKNIGFANTGEMTYKVYGKKGDVQYDEDEFSSREGGEYFCQDCGVILGNCESDIEKYL